MMQRTFGTFQAQLESFTLSESFWNSFNGFVTNWATGSADIIQFFFHK